MIPLPEQPTPGDRPLAYHAFLVRFWRTSPSTCWHASIQRTTGEPARHFAGIDLLFAFLLAQFGEEAPAVMPPHAVDSDDTGAAQPEDVPD